MRVVLHAGAHFTDENRLIECLFRNTETLAAAGVYVPKQRRYNRTLREAVHEALSSGLTHQGIEAVHASVATDRPVDRLILSNTSFFGTPKMAVGRGLLYPNSVGRLSVFKDIFADSDVEIFLGLRNPATLLPALFGWASVQDMATFLGGFEPEEFRWSEMIARICKGLPNLRLTLWCNEDSPLIWGQILRHMAGLAPDQAMIGEFDLLKEIMIDTGWARFEQFMAKRPGLSETQKRQVVFAFLEKFVNVDKLEEELDLPGWDEAKIEALTDIYDEDVEALARLPGVTLLTP